MSLNTTAELAALLGIDDVATLQSFLDDANLIVVEKLSDKGLSDGRLKMVEKYLAGHFYRISEGGDITYDKVGESATSYGGKDSLGKGLQATLFGQTACGLDESNTLQTLSGDMRKAQFRVLTDDSHLFGECGE